MRFLAGYAAGSPSRADPGFSLEVRHLPPPVHRERLRRPGAGRLVKVGTGPAVTAMSFPHFAASANNGGSAMIDTLMVFALLGAIVILVLYVLPRLDGGPGNSEHSTFPE